MNDVFNLFIVKQLRRLLSFSILTTDFADVEFPPRFCVNERSLRFTHLTSPHPTTSQLTSFHLRLVAVTANWVASQSTIRFAVAATNHSTAPDRPDVKIKNHGLVQYGAEHRYSTLPFWQLCALKG